MTVVTLLTKLRLQPGHRCGRYRPTAFLVVPNRCKSGDHWKVSVMFSVTHTSAEETWGAS